MMKITKRAKRAAITVSSMAVARFARSQDDAISRLALAVQDPKIADAGTTADAGNYVTVEFNSGPNLGGQFSARCYGVADPDAEPLSCAELGSPEASVIAEDLPKLYSNVAVDVTGLSSETVDCYLWAYGISGKLSKCQWVGRTDGPWDAYIASNGVTVRCPGVDYGGTFELNGVTYTRRTRAQLDVIVGNSASWNELPKTCTTGVDDMSELFKDVTTINADISSWDTAAVRTMRDMFNNAQAFNNGDTGNNGLKPLNGWDTSKVTDMVSMFNSANAFNQDISNWKTGEVTGMNGMFSAAIVFNNGDTGNSQLKPLNGWDTSKVTDMNNMFNNAGAFNQPIGDWETGAVEKMFYMFSSATVFNQPIGDWDTALVTSMNHMFNNAQAFNQPIGDWETALVTNMNRMFNGATSFNQAIGGWETDAVTVMSSMFDGASVFNQNLRSWDVATVNAQVFSACENFCNGANFADPINQLPAFSGCGTTGC